MKRKLYIIFNRYIKNYRHVDHYVFFTNHDLPCLINFQENYLPYFESSNQLCREIWDLNVPDFRLDCLCVIKDHLMITNDDIYNEMFRIAREMLDNLNPNKITQMERIYHKAVSNLIDWRIEPIPTIFYDGGKRENKLKLSLI